jgi:hypothetical protein
MTQSDAQHCPPDDIAPAPMPWPGAGHTPTDERGGVTVADATANRSDGGFAKLRRLLARKGDDRAQLCLAAGWPVATGSTQNGLATCPYCKADEVPVIDGPAARFMIVGDHEGDNEIAVAEFWHTEAYSS